MSRHSIQHENNGCDSKNFATGSETNPIMSHERIKSLITLSPMNMDNLPLNPFSNSFGNIYNNNSLAQKSQTPSDSNNYEHGVTYGLNNEYGGIPRQKFTIYSSKDQNRTSITAGFYESKYKPNITPVNEILKPNSSKNLFNPFIISTEINNGDDLFQNLPGRKCSLCQRDEVVPLIGNSLNLDICNTCKKQ